MKYEWALLEYRLRKRNEEFEPIFYYNDIGLGEILARRECEFFVKEGITYKQLSSAIEDQLFVIYIDKYEEDFNENSVAASETIKLEIRELNARRNHPLITSEVYDNHFDVLSFIGSIFTYFEGKEWERDSAEIDEDRQVYVLYVTATDQLS